MRSRDTSSVVYVLLCVYLMRYRRHMGNTSIKLPFSGRKLRRLRERRGWLQSDVEDRCTEHGRRVGRDRISRFETGTALPSPPVLATLAAVFEVDVDELLDEERAAA